jgi:hypothetical protein
VIVNSPWTDPRKTVEKCGQRYCIIYRPPWEPVIRAQDYADLHQRVEAEMAVMQGCYRAIVFEDLVSYLFALDRPLPSKQNLIRSWIEAAKEAVLKHA